MPTEMKGPIQSVSRAAAILRCFYDHQELGLQEICDIVQLHKSTTSTLVTTLRNEQLLEKDGETGKYRLGVAAFLLGANSQINLRTITQTFLNRLNEQYKETVNLSVLAGTDVVYLNKLESEYSMRTCTRVGQRLPFYCTANGKAMFAYYPPERQDEILLNLPMKKFTENTISDPAVLRSELRQILREGYACDNEELEEGLCCYAAPLFNRSPLPVAAISLSGPAFRMRTSSREQMIASLKSCAEEISVILKKSSNIFSPDNN